MPLMTLSKATLALFAASLILLLTQQAKAHSYADCIDWRFKDPRYSSWSDKNGACFGYARRFPLKAKPFAKLDSDSPNRHYQQSHKNPDPNHSLACSDGVQGEEPGADETMANPISAAYNGKDKHGRKTGVQTVSKPGGELCIRWPAKNHAVPSEKNQPVTIALSKVNPTKDPTQLQFLGNVIAELNYKNCTDKGKNTDIWPCGGCFKLPANLKPGNYVMQWRWKLNSNEFYTSCADINIKAPSFTAPTVGVPSKSTSTSHTPSSASSASSASQAPTSASSAPSASQSPTSASSAPTSASSAHSASQAPTSASSAPTSASSAHSASQSPTSASSAPSASQSPTSASSAPSASHSTTSVSSAPSASRSPTSASSAPSASHSTTSASSAPSASQAPTSVSSTPSASQAPTSASSAF